MVKREGETNAQAIHHGEANGIGEGEVFIIAPASAEPAQRRSQIERRSFPFAAVLFCRRSA